MADWPPELPPVEMVFIFWDIEAFAVEISLLVRDELDAVGVLNMDDDVEFKVPLGLSVLPPTGGGRGSLLLLRKKKTILEFPLNYLSRFKLIVTVRLHC